MDNSLSHFKDTLNRRKQRTEKKKAKFDRKSSDYKYSTDKESTEFIKVSESKLKGIKQQIRKDAKNRRVKLFIALTIIVIISFLLLHFID